MINIINISSEIVLRSVLDDFTDDKSSLVQVMAWCHLPHDILLFRHQNNHDQNYHGQKIE